MSNKRLFWRKPQRVINFRIIFYFRNERDVPDKLKPASNFANPANSVEALKKFRYKSCHFWGTTASTLCVTANSQNKLSLMTLCMTPLTIMIHYYTNVCRNRLAPWLCLHFCLGGRPVLLACPQAMSFWPSLPAPEFCHFLFTS
jgi:hypothetical protein